MREENMIRIISAAALLAAMTAAPSFAAEPIVGKWRTASGETAAITKCGGSYCINLKTGKYAGKRIGKVSGSGGKYSGSITDPADNKTYSGSARINGNSMKMKGCVAKIFCKTQNWSRM